VASACNGGNVKDTQESLKKGTVGTDRSITAVFERTGKGKVTYSHWQHTKTQTWYDFSHLHVVHTIFSCSSHRAEIVQWVAERMHLFSIIEDRGFKYLMKTGCPDQYIPSHFTVSHDLREVFINAHKHIAKMLQVMITM
jgi:hypothetical protein